MHEGLWGTEPSLPRLACAAAPGVALRVVGDVRIQLPSVVGRP